MLNEQKDDKDPHRLQTALRSVSAPSPVYQSNDYMPYCMDKEIYKLFYDQGCPADNVIPVFWLPFQRHIPVVVPYIEGRLMTNARRREFTVRSADS